MSQLPKGDIPLAAQIQVPAEVTFGHRTTILLPKATGVTGGAASRPLSSQMVSHEGPAVAASPRSQAPALKPNQRCAPPRIVLLLPSTCRLVPGVTVAVCKYIYSSVNKQSSNWSMWEFPQMFNVEKGPVRL